MKKYTMKHVIILFVGIGVFCVVMYSAIVLRDYNISFTGGPHLEPKEQVPVMASYSIDNTAPGKLKIKMPPSGKAIGFSVRASVFPNMMFCRSYNTSFANSNTSTLSLFFKGKTYYVQARYYVKKDNRNIYGKWSEPRPMQVKG